MEWELESLLIPEVDAAKEAGRLLADMPRFWAGANLLERHQLLMAILDAVYIDLKDKKLIVSVKAKPVFQSVLGLSGSVVEGLANSGDGAGIKLETAVGNRNLETKISPGV